MNCKDCLFYDFCNDYNEYPEYVQHCEQTTGKEFECSHFKDKSRFVELPCKVGETVYQVDSERIYESTVKRIIYDTDGIAFDERAIGKSVFLTREEAEKALKEKEEKTI